MMPEDALFYMPPEWAKHACTLMEWPTREEIWPAGLAEIDLAFAGVARAIAAFEPLIIIARPSRVGVVEELCGPIATVMPMEHDDSWARDNGPTFVFNPRGQTAGINWQFNAWGGKFSPWELDNTVAPRLLKKLEIPCFDAPLVLEGGSIHVDGEGTLLTTEECLLNPNRNPHLNRGEIELLLKQYLGVTKIIWLKKGLYGDDTDGHIDNVACFASPGTAIMQSCGDPRDPNYEIYRENLNIMEQASDARGRKLSILTVEQPPARSLGGSRLALSYINFYFVNGGIIMPVFGGDCAQADEQARRILKNTFPGRQVVAVDGMPFIKGGGNVHCITQQMPLTGR